MPLPESRRPHPNRGPHGWRLRHFLGDTPRVRGAHLLIEADLPVAPAESGPLLRTSIKVAMQLEKQLGRGSLALRTAAAQVEAGPAAANPWARWVGALQQAFGVPPYPVVAEDLGERRTRLRLFSPYLFASETWTRVALDLLWLAHEANGKEEVQVDLGAWTRRIDGLGADLPPPNLFAFHHALREQKLPWRWVGGKRTVVGSGSRQRLLLGGTPEEARSIRPSDCSIPIYTVTGSVGKTTTVRLLRQLLQTTGHQIGYADSSEAVAVGKRIKEGDAIGGDSARRILADENVDLAIFEVGRGGIFHPGIPYERSDVAVLLNVGDSHVGEMGVETVEQMADVKELSISRAKIAVLNHDDANCRRLGERRDPQSCAWFSTSAARDVLKTLSLRAGGALGISRASNGEPTGITLWQAGEIVSNLSLDGVAPYHGCLGDKTLEELLAAVAAVAFGPVAVPDLARELPRLRLDASNHAFRTSMHRRANILFVLDKAAEPASFAVLCPFLEQLCERERITRRICVMTRSASQAWRDHRSSCASLHPIFDEFLIFDRSDTYGRSFALPDYSPGSIPPMLRDELQRLNQAAGVDKPIRLYADWDDAEKYLERELEMGDGKTLVLINQPATVVVDLNRKILDFVGDTDRSPGIASGE